MFSSTSLASCAVAGYRRGKKRVVLEMKMSLSGKLLCKGLLPASSPSPPRLSYIGASSSVGWSV